MAIGVIAPLVALPYISRVISQNDFGAYLLYISIASIFITICEYGFNVTTSRRIALASENKKLIVQAIIETLTIKTTLFVLSSAIIAIFWFRRFDSDIIAIIAYVFVNSFQPIWYFTGIQKARFNALYLSMGKLISLIALLYTLNSTTKPVQILTYFIIGGMLSITFGYVHIIQNLWKEVLMSKISVRQTLDNMRNDFSISITALFISIYSSLPPIILSELSTLREVANYSSLEKIYKNIEYFITSAMSVIFPIFVNGFRTEKDKSIRKIILIERLIICVGITIIFLSVIFGKEAFILFYGENFDADSSRIILFSLIPLLGSLSVLWGYIGLLAINKDKVYSKIVGVSAVLNFSVVIATASSFGSTGAVMALALSQAVMTLMMRSKFLKYVK